MPFDERPQPKEVRPVKFPQYRQGDVLLTRIEGLPEGATAKAKPTKRSTLALGEVTGHSHVLVAERTTIREYVMPGSDFGALVDALVVEDVATLTHQEHATLTVPPGTYKVTRQREYSTEHGQRQVQD